MKSHARVVVVGGGVMGVGLLYHLALEGWSDIVLIEKGELTSGSTWHAAGQCPHFNGSLNMTKVHVYGTELYPQLEKLTGQAVSWHGCGGLRLATTDEEVNWLKYVYGISRLAGYECEIIGPDPRSSSTIPIIEHLRHQGRLPHHSPMAMWRLPTSRMPWQRARASSVRRSIAATAGDRREAACPRANGLSCSPTRATLTCEHVVNAAGSYCRRGRPPGPGHNAADRQHAAPLPDHRTGAGTDRFQARNCRSCAIPIQPFAYLREETNGILIGPYETATAHVCWDGQPAAPGIIESRTREQPELDRHDALAGKGHASGFRCSANQAGLKSVISGAITHTPDGNYLSGPAHGPKNYWMHCGASIGICQGGGGR